MFDEYVCYQKHMSSIEYWSKNLAIKTQRSGKVKQTKNHKKQNFDVSKKMSLEVTVLDLGYP